MGVEVEVPDSGCCGMAGSFGFEAAKYDVSMACGERVLLPKVRGASADTIVVADGFSCRTQIEQGGTNRRAMHVAQALKLAYDYGPAGPSAAPPEAAVDAALDGHRPGRLTATALAGALAAGAGGLVLSRRARTSRRRGSPLARRKGHRRRV
jgi:hypothetical protein